MDLKLLKMEKCLKDAGAYDAGMTFEEMQQTLHAINFSRDASETVDVSDNEDASIEGCPSPTIISDNTGRSQWLSKAKGTAAQPAESKFRYRIPRISSKITPLEDLDANKPATVTTRKPTSSQALAGPKASKVRGWQAPDGDIFAGWDNGDPRKYPTLREFPYPAAWHLPKNLPPDVVATNRPPPYNDPLIRKLPYQERFEIIGRYMRDMNEYLVRLSRASTIKAPWGKPVYPSKDFNGSLNKTPRGMRKTSTDQMNISLESQKDTPMEEDDDKEIFSPVPDLFENPFQDITEAEPTDNEAVERKATTTDSSSSSSEAEPTSGHDPDFEEIEEKTKRCRRKVAGTMPRPQRPTTPLAGNTRPPHVGETYATVMIGRPAITVRGGARGAGGKARAGGRGRGKPKPTNEEIMAKSSLFQDEPAGKFGSPMVKVGDKSAARSRQMIDMAQLEELRKLNAAKQRAMMEESIRKSSALLDNDDTDDNDIVAQVSDDDNPDVSLFDKLKRQRVPVPLPKCRPGINRMPRMEFIPRAPTEATKDHDIIEIDSKQAEEDEEQPCPMCNVMFKTSTIQEHAETCEGPDAMSDLVTLSCAICDKVFLLNTDYEVHTSSCIKKERAKKQ